MTEIPPTEQRNPSTMDLDALPTLEIVRAMHVADHEALAAVGRALPQIASAIDQIVPRMSGGGRLFYLGAGTSGRLGVLDASECPPTFNTPPSLVQGLIAGGDGALRNAVEGAEDDLERGMEDLRERGFSARDVLVGIAVSGRTPYVLGGIQYARSVAGLTVGLTCVPESRVSLTTELAIVADTGPEVIAGSTRLKGGTATKMILNMISTAVMVKLGHVHGNLMVNVQPTNDKLKERATHLVALLAEMRPEEAADLLQEAGSVKAAVLMRRHGLSREEAEERLVCAEGRLSKALLAPARS